MQGYQKNRRTWLNKMAEKQKINKKRQKKLLNNYKYQKLKLKE